MSMADTAEYQLGALADAMTEAVRDAEKHGWRSPDYRDGFLAAMEEVAEAMGLRTQVSYAYP